MLEPRSNAEGELLARLAALQAEMIETTQRLVVAEGRAGSAEGELRAVTAERDRLLERSAEDRGERERLLNELTSLHERVAKAEHDRTRAVDALAAHMALPWWRRLFA